MVFEVVEVDTGRTFVRRDGNESGLRYYEEKNLKRENLFTVYKGEKGNI